MSSMKRPKHTLTFPLAERTTVEQVSPDGTTLYAAGYHPPIPLAETNASLIDSVASPGDNAPTAVVWRHEMRLPERRFMADLGLRMEAYQGNSILCTVRVLHIDEFRVEKGCAPPRCT